MRRISHAHTYLHMRSTIHLPHREDPLLYDHDHAPDHALVTAVRNHLYKLQSISIIEAKIRMSLLNQSRLGIDGEALPSPRHASLRRLPVRRLLPETTS